MTREDVALQAPGTRTLTGFPGWRLTGRRQVYRGHRVSNGPWWFSSSGGGRFDLAAPRGTCYVAFDETTAIRETVGEALASLGVIAHDFAADRMVSTLRVPGTHDLADTCADEAAGFGVTRELCSMTPYDVPRAWAAAFDAGFDGIRYQTRFTTGEAANAAAVFGPAGEVSWPVDPRPETFAAAAKRCGIAVQPLPRSVRVLAPPT
ncbi:MAG: RES family NAD+ phosphorylase [Rhodococcus sp. (in: high G+C Gram-positive bacteria)]